MISFRADVQISKIEYYPRGGKTSRAGVIYWAYF
jgi:hypothetical protein